MTTALWLLAAVTVGAVVTLEAWWWLRHGRSSLAVASEWVEERLGFFFAVGIAVVVLVAVFGGSDSAQTDPPPAEAQGFSSESESGCDPNYEGACVPDVPYDVNCDEIDGTDVAVVGEDVNGLDRDGDGVACES